MRSIPQVTPLNLVATPLEVAAAWPADRPLIMLHSGRPNPQWARWSILTTPACTFRHDAKGSHWDRATAIHAPAIRFTHDPLIDLDLIANATHLSREFNTMNFNPIPFVGGWIGYFSYDLGRKIEPRAQHSAQHDIPSDWPLIELSHCPDALIYDHLDSRWIGVGDHESLLNADHNTDEEFEIGAIQPQADPDRYVSMVTRALEYIAAGDAYQVNIAQCFTAPFHGSARALAIEALRKSRPWYGAMIERHDSAIISLSPEMFLRFDPRSREIVSRPIKGTRPSRVDADELLRSSKDAAELHMIVDLVRNDLGRVCEVGTVRAPRPRTIESHPTVHHGVGEVVGKLRGDASVSDILRATFPGGSVTGAPKIRAMQIIDELEDRRRGPYCGSIGYLSDCGGIGLNIAIRTMLVSSGQPHRGQIEYWAGAGIVSDSNPLAEYAETLDKTAVLRDLCRQKPALAQATGQPGLHGAEKVDS